MPIHFPGGDLYLRRPRGGGTVARLDGEHVHEVARYAEDPWFVGGALASHVAVRPVATGLAVYRRIRRGPHFFGRP